jgi:hypothetical protein
MAPHVQEYASKVGGDYDSDWLHRNEACQLQAKPGGEIHVVTTQSNIARAGSQSTLSGNIFVCIMFLLNSTIKNALQSNLTMFMCSYFGMQSHHYYITY